MNIFATLTLDMEPVALVTQDARTFWQRIDDAAEQAASLGAEIGSYVPVETHRPLLSLNALPEDDLARFRIYRVTVDDPAAGQTLAGYSLSYDAEADEVTADAAFSAAPLPQDVPMYKVRKFWALHKADTGVDLEAAIVDYIEGLPEPGRSLALIDLAYSPNLVTTSALALGAKAAMDLDDEEYAAMIWATVAL